MTSKKHVAKVTILNDEYSLRSDAPPEHAQEVARYLDSAIRKVLSSGAVVESNRAVVLAALQVTAELFDARKAVAETREGIQGLSEFVRPLLPPSKRSVG